MSGGGHRGLGLARVNDDDLRVMRIQDDPFPKDRMRDARISPDKDQDIGFFQIFIGIRRRVKTERLFIRGNGGRHALARIPVAVDDPHAELRHRAQQGHLFGHYLSRA